MGWWLLLWLGCASKPTGCVDLGCDKKCVSDRDDALCGDTADASELCWSEGQVCELQADGECGWTPREDQSAYEACLTDIRGP